jgi:hypothetical protein
MVFPSQQSLVFSARSAQYRLLRIASQGRGFPRCRRIAMPAIRGGQKDSVSARFERVVGSVQVRHFAKTRVLAGKSRFV